jgi:hypothetical protein
MLEYYGTILMKTWNASISSGTARGWNSLQSAEDSRINPSINKVSSTYIPLRGSQ